MSKRKRERLIQNKKLMDLARQLEQMRSRTSALSYPAIVVELRNGDEVYHLVIVRKVDMELFNDLCPANAEEPRL